MLKKEGGINMRTERDIIFLIVVLLILLMGFSFLVLSLITMGIHDLIYEETTYKSEVMLLDDIQYLDNERVLYKFGDLIIKDYFVGNTMNINEHYEVEYIMYKNSWMNKNNVWEYYRIKSITN